ncbi:MAG: hypothetical protein SchgKO_08230 [Schleiferiaceae bacterium]
MVINYSNTTGSFYLESPKIYIDRNSFVSFSWKHMLDYSLNPIGGIFDDLSVQIKSVKDTLWETYLLMSDDFGQPNGSVIEWGTEEIPLNGNYINDTIQIRFIYSGYYQPRPLNIDNLRVRPEVEDTIYSIPFYENFDSLPWSPIPGPTIPNDYVIHPDWRAFPTKDEFVPGYKWVTNHGTTSSSGTGPTYDFSGTGNYVYTEGSNHSLGDASLYSPLLDCGGITNPVLSFKYHMYGTSIKTLYVEQWLDSNWVSLDSIVGQQQSLHGDPWRTFQVLLDSTGITRFRLRSAYNPIGPNIQRQDVSIDEVSVEDQFCPLPNDIRIKLSSLSPTSVKLRWRKGSNAIGYDIEYGSVGFSVGSGTRITSSSNAMVISGLLPSTTYEYYVRYRCSATDSTDWAGPFLLVTECPAIVAPFSENFDSTYLPGCWSAPNRVLNEPANAEWKNTSLGFPAYGAAGKHDNTGNSGYAMGVDGSLPYPLDSVSLLSPFIDISQMVEPKMGFSFFSNNIDVPGDNNLFYLDFFDGSQWIPSIFSYSGDSSYWVDVEIDLSNYSISGPVRFRWSVNKIFNEGVGYPFYNDIILDNIWIVDPWGTYCPKTSNISATEIGCDSLTIHWTTASNILSSKIVYGPKGFDFFTGGTIINNPASPLSLEKLGVGQEYDFYFVDSCSAGLGIEKFEVGTDSTQKPQIVYTYGVESYGSSWVTYRFDASNSRFHNDLEWDLGGGWVYNTSIAYRTFFTNKTETITVTANNNCGTSQGVFVLTINNIGIEDLSGEGGFALYPNPNQGVFEFSSEKISDKEIQIEVYSLLGQKVYSSSFVPTSNQPQKRIDLGNVERGAYLFKAVCEGRVVVSSTLMVVD